MYELIHGSARLTSALENAAAEPAKVEALARLLNYIPDQLREDIQALSDFRQKAEEDRGEML